jgi:hypothetical protein
MQIKNARDAHVVLYNVAAQRGWLVDGASALLHLVRTQVVRERFGRSGSLFNRLRFNESIFHHPKIDGGPNAAADILTEEGNTNTSSSRSSTLMLMKVYPYLDSRQFH